jgi:hypothetical protein
LTPAELDAALARLSTSQQQELLTLLEILRREEDERPVDTRTPIAELFGNLRDQYASKSDDAAAFKVAWDRHEAAAAEHFKKLEAERPPPAAWPGIAAIMAWHAERRAEAKALATTDGCPDPCDAPRKPTKLEEDPREAMLRKSLPRATLRDLQDTQSRHAESVVYESIRAEQDAHFYKPVPEQRLNDFRGRTDAPLTPPTYSDS